MDSFESVLVALSRSGVEYILVGGLAVALCGFVRATEDVDILVEASPENLSRLLGCLEAFGEGSARELDLDDFPLEEGCVRIVEDFPLDVFTLISGRTYADLLPMTAEHTLGDVIIRHLNAEGLLLLKAPSLRPKDQLDADALRTILRKTKP